MKLILPLFHLEASLAPGWTRPLGLWPVANGTLLEQLLASARKWLDFDPVFAATGTAMIEWWAATYPDRAGQSWVLEQPDPFQFIRQSRDLWADGAVLLIAGDAVVDANLGGLDQAGADVVCLVRNSKVADGAEAQMTPAGVWWFRHGRLLDQAVRTANFAGQTENLRIDLAQRFRELGIAVATRPADMVEPIDLRLPAVERLLTLNHRLLGFGRGSEDAIDRSYGEDFTVITPVYIDATAIIDSAVIGPYTTIAPGAEIRGSVVRNSIIGPGAVVEDVVLDGAIIGAGAAVKGDTRSLLMAEGTVLALEAA